MKFRNLTYLGARARHAEISLPRRQRITVTWWQDAAVGQAVEHAAGTAVVQRVSGDGRIRPGADGALTVHAQQVIPAASLAEIEGAVASMREGA